MTRPRFLFAVCQVGAEPVLKREIAREWPTWRLAFSRPGFVTFKLPDDFDQPEDFDLKSVFARTYGFSLGKLVGDQAPDLAAQVWQLAGAGPLGPAKHEDAADRPFGQLHVWQRDRALPGDHEFEPGPTPLADEVGQIILAACPTSEGTAAPPPLNARAHVGQRVLDVVLVEPNEWWVGYHRAASVPSRWPGGVCDFDVPEDMINRAYLKMSEALIWARFPIQAGDRCVELGAAPGGACQALLDRGLEVIGIDPAQMDESLAGRPHFTHIRKRAADLKRREFAGIPWLVADLNVAPQYTLDAVESIVTHSSVHVRGMLLTLKLPQWEVVDELPTHLERIRSWGFDYVRARQLAFNRHELCVAVLKSRGLRRARRGKREEGRVKGEG